MTKATVAGKAIEVLFSEQKIADRVVEMAAEIKRSEHERLLVVSILKGSFIFAADLLRALHGVGLAPEVEFISLSSYGAGTTSSGEIKILRDIESDVTGRSILLLDDILESGRTIAFAKDLMTARGATGVEICVLLDKPHRRAVEIEADYVGFDCPDKFVVGYGMDMAHGFRQLPYVGVITG
jgi:hypoxanthine phosphoribosyltransferase